MKLRIKPHPAVALILQHLRFEARSFDVAGSAGERKRLDRKREKWVNNGLSFNTGMNSKQVKITD